jgi:hypothetical protein
VGVEARPGDQSQEQTCDEEAGIRGEGVPGCPHHLLYEIGQTQCRKLNHPRKVQWATQQTLQWLLSSSIRKDLEQKRHELFCRRKLVPEVEPEGHNGMSLCCLELPSWNAPYMRWCVSCSWKYPSKGLDDIRKVVPVSGR